MNIIINFIISIYSYFCEMITIIHNNLKQYNCYIILINFIGNINTKIKKNIFNYHSDPDLPFESNMKLTTNYELLIDYKYKDFGYNSLLLYKFIDNDKEYVYSKIYTNKDINKFNKSIHISNTESADHKFLAIQYIHPDMNEQLILNIDKKYFAIGNDILDSIFIKYFLSKNFHKSHYIFDNNYTINIIDKNCSFHTIDFNSYINFHDDKWIIKKK